ncbi:MAG: hypothetical protein HYR64_06030 [Fimbriimonas ginsengisoli]|uniref:DUF6036 domain-containing protein n=1 Tax=Fimbriimonas ginsengisoli TaxID=1005039 RepID=A0A931LSR8_FIMGI|nr:hypothetical protein [Fimbriimonas ginsengisoli]
MSGSSQKIPQLEGTLARLHASLTGLGLPYAVIGGIAVILRGYDRSTQDLDAVVWGADGRLPELVAELGKNGLHLRRDDGVEFAKRNRILLLKSPDGTQADLSLGALPFEHELIRRATLELLGKSLSVPIATVEDLLIMKFIASRDRDLDDIRRLMDLHPELDRKRIARIVREYAKALNQPELIGNVRALLGTKRQRSHPVAT